MVAALGLVLVALLWREPLTRRVTAWALLANPAPSSEALQASLRDASDPDQAIRAAWSTGKIVHRQVAVRELAGRPATGVPLPSELETILLAAALDPDLSVREMALGGLRFHRHLLATTMAGAQLQDVDPQVRLLGLHHLKPASASEGLAWVAPLTEDADLRVVGTALKLLERWSDEDFGVKLADTVEVRDVQTGEKGYRPEGLARVQAAVQQAREWWSQHGTEYTNAPPRLPAALFEALMPLPAGDFKLSSLSGRTVRLSDFRGKAVLINFWTTWCTACLVEIPVLVELQERQGDRLAVLGVSLDAVPDGHGHLGGHDGVALDAGHDDPEAHDGHGHDAHQEPTLAEVRARVARTAKKMRINYPVLLDEHNVVGGRFNGGELPTTVILDRAGNIRRRFVGTRTLPVFEAMLAEAAQPQPAARNK